MSLETSQAQLDADGVALGLIGVLEMLWQDFAFRAGADIDRAAAKRRAMSYLRSIFPGQFVTPTDAGVAGGDKRLAGWVESAAPPDAIETQKLVRRSGRVVASSPVSR